MKLLLPKEIKELEIKSVSKQGTNLLSLMEEASYVFFRWFMRNLPIPSDTVSIYIGKGNNGADGLCIASYMSSVFKTVKVIIIEKNENIESLWAKMYNRVSHIENLEFIDFQPTIQNAALSKIIIDAIFGIGLNRKASAVWEEAIKQLNSSGSYIYSVDSPSGLYENSEIEDTIVEAHATLKFFRPLPWFFYKEYAPFLGKWEYLPIGLDELIADESTSSYHITIAEEVKHMIQHKSPFAHKGTYGHALIYAASPNMRGATCLTIKGAINAGAGKITVATTEEQYGFYQSLFPEVICKSIMEINKSVYTYDAVCIGPGFGNGKDGIIQTSLKRPHLVIDADGLNAIARNSWLDDVVEGTIITPHIGEFRQLFGKYETRKDYVSRQQQESIKRRIYIILKGRYTSITDPQGNVYFNATGNEGMATAGSGDVLTGVLTSILARTRNPLNACLSSVYIHGKSGDLAAVELSKISMSAGDIAGNIPKAIKTTISR